MKSAIKDRRIFFAACAAVLLFVMFCTRLILKTDDGNFLGIALAPGFSYKGFLTNRYNTVSGRTVNEFLLMFFLKHDPVFYKLCNSALICYVIWFFIRLCCLFGEKTDRSELFCVSGLFLTAISCLNPAAFWFSGSFSYLWPFAGMLMLIYPLLCSIFNDKFNYGSFILSVPASLLATAQEQAAVCSLSIYAVLLAVVFMKHRLHKPLFFIPLVSAALLSYHLFSSPGIKGRMANEAAGGYSGYFGASFARKFAAGLGNAYANIFFMSFFLTIVFSLLLSKKAGRFKTGAVITAMTCIVSNAASLLISKTLPHIVIREFFTEPARSFHITAAAVIIFVFGSLQFLLILYMSLLVFKKDRYAGTAVLICIAAGAECAAAMGFTSALFNSGQRVYFYTNALNITAGIILLSSMKEDRQIKIITNSSYIYSAVMFVIDIFAFTFAEIPLMG